MSNSNTLITVFSGFQGHHVKSRYNYIRFLKNSAHTRLYILDDFGYEQVGSYYLGDKCHLLSNNAIDQLLQYVTKKYNTNEMVFAGSSKGGTAALFYGLKLHENYIISGSPQYRVGDYLNQNEYHRCILKNIIDSIHTPQWLNLFVKNEIESFNGLTKIKLIYSSCEETYENDVKYLIQDLENSSILIELVDEKFQDHGDIGKVFPKHIREFG